MLNYSYKTHVLGRVGSTILNPDNKIKLISPLKDDIVVEN